jgi:uncharacterized protein YndB with AHSA1/START domain
LGWVRARSNRAFGGVNIVWNERMRFMRNTALVIFIVMIMAIFPFASRAQDDNRLVHEGIVNAPVDQVWAAFTTSEGLESWMASHAKIDFKIGGTMKSQYDPKGTIDDAKAIENTILSYEPLRMLSFKVTKAPDTFPFPNAIKSMWTVVYFIPEGDKATRVREVSMGFGSDDESKKMREFFNRGNAFTLQRLQKRFAPKADAK